MKNAGITGMEEQLTDKRNFALEYDSSWSKYDFIVKLFQLGRDKAHRLKALRFAGLKPGDTVLDVCCGSGLSIEAIRSIIGPAGKVIAVDANAHMLALAEKRAKKYGWDNVTFICSDIDLLDIPEKIDLALFALCWYDRAVCTGWVKHVSRFLDPANGKMCFFDYKFPDNWVKHVASPILWVLVKWLGEAYSVDELKWDPDEEIGTLLKDPRSTSFYLDSIITICGKPK